MAAVSCSQLPGGDTASYPATPEYGVLATGAQGGSFIDEFESAAGLRSRWQWLEEDPTSWSIQNSGLRSYLRLQVATQPKRNILLTRKAIPDGRDFTIETMVVFRPTADFQGGGLLVYQDDNNCLTAIRAFCDLGGPICVGDGFYSDLVVGGVWESPNYATEIPAFSAAAPTAVAVWLRISREGTIYNVYYSLNGLDWTLVGSHVANFRNVRVGLTAGNNQAGDPATTASFDYFSLMR